MCNGYDKAGNHNFDDLDEWLCEYVDGTIDPVVCKALEEYMQMNPELKMHVERMRSARSLLCQYGCSHQAPRGLQPRLRRRLASEIMNESQPLLPERKQQLIKLATFTSLFALLLLFAVNQTESNLQPTSQPVASSPGQTPLSPSILLPPTPLASSPKKATLEYSLLNNRYFSIFTQPHLNATQLYSPPTLFMPTLRSPAFSQQSAPILAN